MLDKMSYEDKEKIVKYINSYALDCTKKEININKIDYLLREWNEKKQYIYEKFNNNFIIEKKINYHSIPELISEDIKELLNCDNFCYNIKWDILNFFIDYNYYSTDKIDYFERIKNLISPDTLAKGKYEGESFKIYNNKTDKYIQINKGCKPLKVLQKICLSFDLCTEEAFKRFRDKISTALNRKDINGTMCLSIHPLDYMTMSDNDYGWSSCMSWMESGCYRQGTVEMMNSPMVIVGYLKNSEDNNSFNDWNSKKWRELYIVNPKDEFIINVKSYPYRADTLSKMNVEWLQEIFFPNNKIYESDSSWTFFDNDATLLFEISPTTNNMYNDFDHSYNLFCSINPENKKNVYKFCYSGASECMCCGELDPSFNSEEDLACRYCNNIKYCCECGEPYEEDYLYYVDDVGYVCEHCYENYYSKCAYNGDIYDNSYMRTIKIVNEENSIIKDEFKVYEYNLSNFLEKYLFDISLIKNYNLDKDCIYINAKDFNIERFRNNRADF